MTTTYTLGKRVKFGANITNELAWKDHKDVRGIEMYARDMRTGEYVQVLETAPEQYVDGEAQAWSTGNFGTMEAAQKFGAMAWRYINSAGAGA